MLESAVAGEERRGLAPAQRHPVNIPNTGFDNAGPIGFRLFSAAALTARPRRAASNGLWTLDVVDRVDIVDLDVMDLVDGLRPSRP